MKLKNVGGKEGYAVFEVTNDEGKVLGYIIVTPNGEALAGNFSEIGYALAEIDCHIEEGKPKMPNPFN